MTIEPHKNPELRALGLRALTTAGTVAFYVASCLSPNAVLAAPAAEGEGESPGAARDEQPVGGVDTPDSEVSDSGRAQALRRVAEDRFFEEDYEGALEAFSEAMELSPHSTDLFNMGRIHEEMGDLPEALQRYEQFVSQPRIPLEERAAAADRIEVLRKLVKDEEPASTADSGDAAAAARADELADRAYRDERRAQTRLLSAGAAVAALGAAVGVGGGVGFGIVARRNSDKIDDLSAGQNPGRLTLREAEDLEARGRDFETMQIAAMATGGAMLTAGVVMIIVAQERRSKADRARGRTSRRSISPVLSSRTVGVRARWSF
ncbi:MAG: tetratricopeptide repeat protein [Nannocystales bacterium]